MQRKRQWKLEWCACIKLSTVYLVCLGNPLLHLDLLVWHTGVTVCIYKTVCQPKDLLFEGGKVLWLWVHKIKRNCSLIPLTPICLVATSQVQFKQADVQSGNSSKFTLFTSFLRKEKNSIMSSENNSGFY